VCYLTRILIFAENGTLRLFKLIRALRMINPNRFNNILLAFCCFLIPWELAGQFRNQMPDWQLLDNPGRLVKANASYQDLDGWTHYYQEEGNYLILSVKSNGQDIGNPEQQLRITSGLLSGFGKSANDLSGASYIENSIWLTMNRYWRIEKGNPILEPVRVRFYYSREDYNDLLSGLEEIGLEQKQSGELLFFALTGGAVHPFTNRPESGRATFTPLRDTLEAQATPWRDDLYFAEFELRTLKAGGSGGFLIPVAQDNHQIGGQILLADGRPVQGVQFPSTVSGATVQTDDQGYFNLANIPAGRDYFLEPRMDGDPQEELTVLDLIALEKRLATQEAFDDPFRELAADIDRSGTVDHIDLDILRRLIHGQAVLAPDRVWRFVPKQHTFQEGRNPLFPAPPGSIMVNKILSDQINQDFVAIKAGNVATEQEYPNDPPVLLDAGFALGEVESCGTGEEINVDLQVSGFDDIMGFQFTIIWDPQVVEFIGADEFNLPGFSEASFGTDDLRKGRLSVAWHTTTTSKKTRLQDESVICRLKFNAIGLDDSETEITFEESPTPIQVLRKNLSPSNVLFTAGSIQIKWETGVESFSADIQNVTCFSNQDGAIDLTITGPYGPYRYQWSTGETTEDLTELLPGAYFVTVTGRAKCPLVSDSLIVEEPRVLFVHNLNVRQIQCPAGNDGAISFRTSGGSPPYSYKWSNGSVASWVGNLYPGEYGVTISDQNGCRVSESFVIDEAPPLYINYSVAPAAGPFEANGAIVVNGLQGSIPPQQFTWNTGATGPKADDLAPGNYAVTVTDASYCQYILQFEVPEGKSPTSLRAELPGTTLEAGKMELLKTESPVDQTVQIRIFDSGSRMTWQMIVPLMRGENRMYFSVPEEPGSYLLQIQPRYDAVSSLRFTVE
jgi:hypothetical protein